MAPARCVGAISRLSPAATSRDERGRHTISIVAIVLNLVALILVIGLSWVGMMWMAGRVHRRGRGIQLTELDAPGEPCHECDGVGAKQRLGAIEPCPVCEGTGVVTPLPG